jgi:selenophosphate synthetase-related protein
MASDSDCSRFAAMPDPVALAALVRNSPELLAKRDLRLVKKLGPVGDGDDGALIAHGDEWIVLCGEAILPSFVAAQPRAAGASAVVTNVSDVRAMGGRPLAILDMLVSPDETHAELVLEGLAWAAELLGVEVVGGHLTIGGPASLSATCTGIARRPLRAAAARPGDVLLAAFCLEGRYMSDDSDFFTSLRDRAPEHLRTDGDALIEVAEHGLCHAARDVSMPGAAGSLLQLLEAAGCGAVLDVDRLPRPEGVAIERWLRTFPSFGFLLAAATPEDAAAAREIFTRRGLACEVCGAFEATRRLDLESGAGRATVWDFDIAPLTGLGGDRARA